MAQQSDAAPAWDKPAPALSSMPAEILAKIFAFAIPARIVVQAGIKLKYNASTRRLEQAIEWNPRWVPELRRLSKSLKSIIGPIIYSRINFPHEFLKWTQPKRLARSLRHDEHLPKKDGSENALGGSKFCKTWLHQLDRHLRKICGLPSACLRNAKKRVVSNMASGGRV